MERIIGIDLGTTNSCVSYLDENGIAKIIPSELGGQTLPSVVAFKDDGRVVGENALIQTEVSKDVIMSHKTQLGTDTKFSVNGINLTPTQVSAIILSKLREQAQIHLNERVRKVVLTVPAYFNNSQRKETIAAAQIAGMEVVSLINEPTAAALAYGIEKGLTNEKVLVYDLGGGTFDVSILTIKDGDYEVISTRGLTKLGGDTFTDELTSYVINAFHEQSGINLTQTDNLTLARLRNAVELAKRELSFSNIAEVIVPFIPNPVGDTAFLTLRIPVTRTAFNKLIAGYVERTKIAMFQAMTDAGLRMSELTKVILVGGSTRVPYVYKMVQSVTGIDPARDTNPDEIVAKGAAIKAGLLNHIITDIELIDVLPLSLSLETIGGVSTVIIPRNSPLPAHHTRTFTTVKSNQDTISIKVFQGEKKFTKDNEFVGEVKFDDITPMPRGMPKIDVTFHIDRNGILTVTVDESMQGKKYPRNATITNSLNLTPEQIAKMVEEGEEEESLIKSIKSSLKEIENLTYLTPSIVNDSEKEILSSSKSALYYVTDQRELKQLKAMYEKLNSLRDEILNRSMSS